MVQGSELQQGKVCLGMLALGQWSGERSDFVHSIIQCVEYPKARSKCLMIVEVCPGLTF